MTALVQVTGFTRKFNVIDFIKLIRRVTGESLTPAKNRVESLLDGRPFSIELPDAEAADRFIADATAIGAVVCRRDS